MSLQVFQPCRLGFLYKLSVQVFIAGDKGNIHQGAVFLHYGSLKQLALIQEVVEDGRFLLVALLDCLKPSHILQPFKDLAAHIDAVAVGRIIQRISVRMGLIGQHGGRSRKHILRNQILTYDHDHHSGRPDIFLYAAVYDSIFRHVHRFGKEAGGYVCYQRLSLCVGKRLKLGAVNGIVLTNIYIVRVLADGQV